MDLAHGCHFHSPRQDVGNCLQADPYIHRNQKVADGKHVAMVLLLGWSYTKDLFWEQL